MDVFCIDGVDIDSIDGMVEKHSVSAFQYFLQIECIRNTYTLC